MAYSQDMRKAAVRHLRAAQILYERNGPGEQPGCKAVAGYLFGLAGELAVKELMRDSGMNPLPNTERRDDPFFAHFPVLKTMLSTARGAARENCGNSLKIPACSKIGMLRCATHQPRTSMQIGWKRGRYLPSGSLKGWERYERVA